MNDRTSTEESGIDAHQSQESNAAETVSPPFAAPPTPPSESPVAASPQPEEFDRAGFWLRSVAFVIDLSILTMFSVILLLVSLVISWMGVEVNNPDIEVANSFSLSVLGKLTQVMAIAAYFTILHGETGQTIGKSLLGLRVCTLDGESLSYGRALMRFLAYGPSLFFFAVGFIWVGLNPGKRGWHDLLTGTMVVNKYRD